MASGIQKCGYLKIKRPPTSGKVRIKAWQLKYFVLRNVPPIFEYFKDELSFTLSRNTKEKNKINLENVIHIGTTDASKTQRNAFMIVDEEHGAIMLATDSEQETKEWVDVLNKVSGKSTSLLNSPKTGEFTYPEPASPLPLSNLNKTGNFGSPELSMFTLSSSENYQGFSVTTRLTPSSERLGIRDDYTMYITNEYVAIHDIETNALVVQWPIVGLRGWKSEPADAAGRRHIKLLTLEAGRKSSTGEGLYQFFTDFGNLIANEIRLRSNALCRVTAVENKEKSNSFDDVFQESNDRNKTQTSCRSASNAATVIKSQKTHIRERSASDNNIILAKVQNSSPKSLRKELLQDKLTKDIAKNILPILEDSISSTQTADNAYLDLIGDADAVPIHIGDSDHQKSLDSLSQNSDEEIILQKTLSNTAHEMNGGQNYIDDSEINDYRKKVLKTKSVDTKNTIEPYTDPACVKRTEIQAQKQTPSNTLCQDILDQLSNPQTHQGNIFKEKQNVAENITAKGAKTENTEVLSVLTRKTNQSANETNEDSTTATTNCSNSQSQTGLNKLSSGEQSSDLGQLEKEESSLMRKRQGSSINEKRIFPHGREEAMDLLEKVVCNLQTPQACPQERIFPPRREDKVEKVPTREAPTGSNVRRLDSKRTIEKSKSHCGFETAPQADKPPPLPVRPEMARTKPSASLGDISKDLTRPLDFHKDLHRQLSPWNNNTPALGAPWGPESVVHARLLQRSTSGTSLGAVREAHQALRNVEKSSSPSSDRTRSPSTRGSLDSPPPIQENESFTDDDLEGKKRRGSKATTFISRVLNTLNPSDSKRRASCDSVSSGTSKDFDAAKRGRSCSVVPGGIVNEGWSPEQSLDVPSPEGSPQNLRKVLPGARRLSHDPNLDRSRKLFVGSPTFDSRTKEEIRQREKAKERERERSELPNEPPPELPPRKKSDPPPLPPRIRKSSSDSCSSGPSSPKNRQSSEANEITPPPIPPRRLDDRRSTAPAIHLTMSSPDEKPLERILADLAGQEAANSSFPGASRTKQSPNNLVTKTTKDVSCPIPRRPPAIRSQTLPDRACVFDVHEIKNNANKTENTFVSIEMQRKKDDIPDSECDSIDAPSQSGATPISNQLKRSTGSPTGNGGRCSPGHTPPQSLNVQSHNGGIVLADSPSTTISV